jgi:putative glutamine amidotransferase
MKPIIGLTVSYAAGGEDRSPSESGSFYVNRPYVESVLQAGGIPVYLPYITDERELAHLACRLDGLLLTGGRDIDPKFFGEPRHPACGPVIEERSASDIGWTRMALSRKIPILGICLGVQTLNVALGGDLYQDVPSQFESRVVHRQAEPDRTSTAHTVVVTPGSLLYRVTHLAELAVNSLHHQAVRRIGEGLVVNARAPDGLVEGLEYPSSEFCLAVQWHPEDLTDRVEHRALFEAFVQASWRWAR